MCGKQLLLLDQTSMFTPHVAPLLLSCFPPALFVLAVLSTSCLIQQSRPGLFSTPQGLVSRDVIDLASFPRPRS